MLKVHGATVHIHHRHLLLLRLRLRWYSDSKGEETPTVETSTLFNDAVLTCRRQHPQPVSCCLLFGLITCQTQQLDVVTQSSQLHYLLLVFIAHRQIVECLIIHPHTPIGKVWIYRYCLFFFCLYIRLQNSLPRLKLAASNFARLFIGVQSWESQFLLNFLLPQ